MVRTVTGNYSFPLVHNGPFDIDSCLACHAESPRFREVEAHRDMAIQQALLAHEMTCAGTCHLPAHPADSLNGAGAIAQ
ncbi:MAG: hypothetical protein MJA83_06340, partial [Gammaproteobacteria bacterium]|nr:hypothetical protein [Gammaproteobacteria bacterium]